jgi:WD40 repeat protein
VTGDVRNSVGPARGTGVATLSDIMRSVGIASETLTHTARRHIGPINAVAISSAPERLALGGNVVLLVDGADGQHFSCCDHPRPVQSVALDAAGSVLATACDDVVARIWNVESGTLRAALEHAAGVSSVYLSADGGHLVTGCVDGTAHVFDLATQKRVRSFPAACAERLHSVFLSADGALLLTESHARADLWETRDGRHGTMFPARGALVREQQPLFHSMTASTMSGASVLLWNAWSGECLRRLEHPAPVACAFLFDDGRQLLSACHDGRVRRWRSEPARCEQLFEGHIDPVRSVVVSSSRAEAISAGDDETARVWDLQSGSCRRVVHDVATAVIAVLPSRDSRELWVAGYDASIAAYDLGSGRCTRRLRGHAAWVGALCESRSGMSIASGSHDGTARVWSAADGSCVRTVPSGITHAVALLDGGRLLLTGNREGILQLWHVASGELLARVGATGAAIRGMTVSESEILVITGDDAGVMRWWNLETRQCHRVVQAHERTVHDLALSPDGRFCVSGSSDGTAKRWDVATGRCRNEVGRHPEGIRPVCASADGSRVYTGGYDGAISAWDGESGERVAHVDDAHAGWVRSLRSSADGRLLISGSKDGTVKFRDSQSLELRATLRNLREGFLWTAPADVNAPAGWVWTDREDLIDVRGTKSEAPLPADDPRRRAYLEVYNSQQSTLSRLRTSDAADGERLTLLVTLQAQLREREARRQLEYRPPVETP